PQTWSVAIELQFYLLSPFLARNVSTRFLVIFALILAFARCNCITFFGLDYDPWNYRFSPFELFNFVVGMIACRFMWLNLETRKVVQKACDRLLPNTNVFSYVAFTLAAFFLFRFLLGGQSFTLRTLTSVSLLTKEAAALGFIAIWGCTIPFLFCMTKSNKLDRFIGELSFPVYLLHLTVAVAVQETFSSMNYSARLFGETSFLITAVIAVGLQIGPLRYLESWRQRSVQAVPAD
ncbi:MAG: acyltransferase, partial [Planctomycetaceae bacterium]|nr:acyltransferase [Planctomycetaceae bacterium]